MSIHHKHCEFEASGNTCTCEFNKPNKSATVLETDAVSVDTVSLVHKEAGRSSGNVSVSLTIEESSMERLHESSDVHNILPVKNLNNNDVFQGSGNTSWIQAFLMSGISIVLLCTGLLLFHSYIKQFLVWLEEQNELIAIFVFVLLFTIVAFPMTWGYILLNLAAGYLYGIMYGLALVVFSCLIGVPIAHVFTRHLLYDVVRNRCIGHNESMNAVLATVEQRHAFKVVGLTRLTPVPFGLQNAVFAVSYLRTYITTCHKPYTNVLC